MNEKLLNRIYAKLDVMLYFTTHKPTLMHFYRLRERLIKGQKLTKKMSENLAWIKRDAERELENDRSKID